MKTLIKVALMALMAFAVTSLSAQPGSRQGREQRQPMKPEEVAKMMTARMTKSLNLSEAQQKKVYDLNLTMVKNRPMMHRDPRQQQTQEQREAARKEFQKSQQDYRAKLKAILSQEQYAQWEKEQAMRMQRGNRGMGIGPQMPQGQQAESTKSYNKQDKHKKEDKKEKKNKKK